MTRDESDFPSFDLFDLNPKLLYISDNVNFLISIQWYILTKVRYFTSDSINQMKIKSLKFHGFNDHMPLQRIWNKIILLNLCIRFHLYINTARFWFGEPAVGGLKFSMTQKKLKKVPVGEVPVWGSPNRGKCQWTNDFFQFWRR